MKNKIIIGMGIVIAILLYLYFSKPTVIGTVTETIIEHDTIIKIVDNTKPQTIKKVFIKVPVPVTVYDTVNNTIIKTDTIFKDKEVTKYVYKDTLKNGILTSTILADMIYKRSIELKTLNTTTTTTMTNTIAQSMFMFGPNGTLSFTGEFKSASINAYYIHKDKWLVNGGVGYEINAKEPTVNFGTAFKF